MWEKVSKGRYEYRQNVTNSQLLAKYLILGADLRELYENFDTPQAKKFLSEMIDQHQEIFEDAQL